MVCMRLIVRSITKATHSIAVLLTFCKWLVHAETQRNAADAPRRSFVLPDPYPRPNPLRTTEEHISISISNTDIVPGYPENGRDSIGPPYISMEMADLIVLNEELGLCCGSNVVGNFKVAADGEDFKELVASYIIDPQSTKQYGDTIGCWDVSLVTDMTGAFEDHADFNEPLNCWNVGNVATMSELFLGAASFNQNLTSWDVSNVVTMNEMFSGATEFNGDVSAWDVKSVEDFSYMFSRAVNFNSDISQWEPINAFQMRYMFDSALEFNVDISGWDVSSVDTFRGMFYNAALFNQNIGVWTTSSATDIAWMFYFALEFNQDVSTWDITNVESIWRTFEGAAKFNQSLCDWIGKDDMLEFIGNTFEGTNCDNTMNPVIGSGPYCATCLTPL